MALVLLIWWLYIHQWIEMCICTLSTRFSSVLNLPSAWTLDGAERIPLRAPPPKTGTSYFVPQHVWLIWILSSQTPCREDSLQNIQPHFPVNESLVCNEKKHVEGFVSAVHSDCKQLGNRRHVDRVVYRYDGGCVVLVVKMRLTNVSKWAWKDPMRVRSSLSTV